MPSLLTFVARHVSFGSANDERAFFDWSRRLEGFDEVTGVGAEVRISIRSELEEHTLRDVIALFHRYGVDLTQIPALVSVESHPWLRAREAYWYEAMFPDERALDTPGPDP